jgi:hypothetical protein
MTDKLLEQGSTLLQGEDGNLKVVSPNGATIDSFAVIPVTAFPFTRDYTESPSDDEGMTDIELSVTLKGFKPLDATITVITADFLKDRIKDEVFPGDATHVALAENPVRIIAVKFCGDWRRAM